MIPLPQTGWVDSLSPPEMQNTGAAGGVGGGRGYSDLSWLAPASWVK